MTEHFQVASIGAGSGHREAGRGRADRLRRRAPPAATGQPAVADDLPELSFGGADDEGLGGCLGTYTGGRAAGRLGRRCT